MSCTSWPAGDLPPVQRVRLAHPATHGLPTWDKTAHDVHFPYYAIDDHTAVQVVGGKVDVVSEGRLKLVKPDSLPPQ